MSLKPSIVIKGWVYAQEQTKFDSDTGTFKPAGFICYVLPYESDSTTFGVNVGQIEHRYELPEGFDIKAETIRQKVAALQKAKEEAGREFAEKVAQINQQLAELQAIEG